MTEKPSLRLPTVIAGIATLVGPVAAALSETGHRRLFPHSPLGEVWLLAAIAAVGMVLGCISVVKGAKAAGVICILINAVVFAFYGYVAVFFTLGGNR